MTRGPHFHSFGMKCVVALHAFLRSQLGLSFGQGKQVGSKPPARSVASEAIGCDAKWERTPNFLNSAPLVCDHKASKTSDDCFIDQMAKAGASPAATRFSPGLIHENSGEFGVMMRFKKLEPVDMVKLGMKPSGKLWMR
ncbi:MAG: hypothetical protein ABR987_24665 [Terracidiphilus sp.]